MAQQHKVGKTHTKIIKEGNLTSVRYVRTDVVTFSPTFVRLDTGGWFTTTTKTRMNQASNQFNLGFRVFQKKKKWFCSYKGIVMAFEGNVLQFNQLKASDLF